MQLVGRGHAVHNMIRVGHTRVRQSEEKTRKYVCVNALDENRLFV
jgi:hypothetical protein